jgi:hypothetical protein
MKLEHLEEVNKLNNTLVKLRAAAESTYTFIEEVTIRGPDSGGVEGFEMGYMATFAVHRDGSGPKINLNGCYVALEVADAILDVLKAKIVLAESRLQDLGVEFLRTAR